jgi:hypothetical protein
LYKLLFEKKYSKVYVNQKGKMPLDKELGFLLFSETLAEGATLAKRVAQFVFLETFANVFRCGRFEDFYEALLLNMTKRNLSAII